MRNSPLFADPFEAFEGLTKDAEVARRREKEKKEEVLSKKFLPKWNIA